MSSQQANYSLPRTKSLTGASRAKRWPSWALGTSVAASALALLPTASPAAAATHKGARSGVVDIVYWAGHASGALHAAVVAEVAKFNATHPNIHVTFIAKGASKHGLAAFEAGVAPNVAMISSYALAPMVEARAVLNLKPYLDGPDGLSPSEIRQWFYPVVWEDMQTGPGAQYLFPLEKKSVQVIYYNEDLFKKAGIASPPASWPEFSSDLAKLTALGASC